MYVLQKVYGKFVNQISLDNIEQVLSVGYNVEFLGCWENEIK